MTCLEHCTKEVGHHPGGNREDSTDFRPRRDLFEADFGINHLGGVL